jgi:hypothetical protein
VALHPREIGFTMLLLLEFEKLGKDKVPEEIRTRYGDDFVDKFCFDGNHDDSVHTPAQSCQDE